MELKGILCASHYHKLSRKNIAPRLSVLEAISVPGLELFYASRGPVLSTPETGPLEYEVPWGQRGQETSHTCGEPAL